VTLIDHREVADWWALPATTLDHPGVADFLATTHGLAGRKFASDSRDVAEHFEDVLPGGAIVVRDDSGRVRGYGLLRQPHGDEIGAEFVFDPTAPGAAAEEVVTATVARFRTEAIGRPDAYLRVIAGDDQQRVLEALVAHGAHREAEFIRTRKPLDAEDVSALDAAEIPGLAVIGWPAVLSRGLGEQLRSLQYDTFLEHFGNMSKSPAAFEHHIHSRGFTPDFSIAAVDEAGDVVGYVLGSTYTAGAAPGEERSAHTDYIGVRADQRKRGIGELLLRKIWLAALRRGVPVASLGTDIHNRSNAHLLYERLGYVAVERQYAYRIDGTS
jgi:ribosomal protein S18 acetylase RimI-like enzyme